MLQEIRLRDLGVIDDAVVPLHAGLTVLTGETGAGKTMVVSGLGLLLGGRGDAGLVRDGAVRTVVEGLVDLPVGHPAMTRAADAGADVEDGLVLVRTVSGEGRSRAHIGGRSAPVGVLAEIGEHLVAVHGQADQWRLRSTEEHRDLLDAYGGASLQRAVELHGTLFAERQAVARELGDLQSRLRERAQELEFLSVGLARIEAADPRPGEDEELRAESERLTHAADLLLAASEAGALLGGSDDPYDAAPEALSVTDALGRARSTLGQAGVNDPALAALAERVAEVGHLVNDLVADLADYRSGIDLDAGRADAVEERRSVLAGLARTYGPTMADVLQWAKEAAVRADDLAGTDDRLEVLRGRLATISTDLAAAGTALTTARRTAAVRLGTAVTAELAHLAMARASVVVAVEPRATVTREGADDVEIRLAAAPGATARSVARAASGGELSRVMLAIEVVTASRTGMVPTYVFDEVDAGIGGRAALDVGSRLAALARHAQVVVVTHLPQVAAYADRHLVVTKASDGRVTSSGVVEVRGAEREAELARMMGGVQSQTALRHARELLAEAVARRA